MSLRQWEAAAWKWRMRRAFLNHVWMLLCRALGRRAGIWPADLSVEGTNVCNAACIFCVYPEMQRPKAVMPMELYRRIIDEYVRMDGAEVDLAPIVGEPLADPYLFERLDVLRARREIRSFHFYTNAILMRPEHQRRLAEYGERLLIRVSFGGFDRETYRRIMGVDGFEAATAAVRGLVEHKRGGSTIGLAIELRVPPGSERGEFWDFLVAARGDGLLGIEKSGGYDVRIGMVSPDALAEAGLGLNPLRARSGPCYRLFTTPVVLADGRVGACGCARDVEASLVVGDLGTQRLDEVLSSPELHALIERQTRGDFPDVCRECRYYRPVVPSGILSLLIRALRRSSPSVC